MSLETPELHNLDDLRFQTLVDEARRLIPQLFPEWTDYNLSDPGITLIELFAWMSELIVYRLNKVPEKNYIKFLEMLGVQQQHAQPAEAELTFRLSTPFPLDSSDARIDTNVRIPAGTRVAANAADDEQQDLIFTVDRSVDVVVPQLRYLANDAGKIGEIYKWKSQKIREWGFAAFGDQLVPDTGALYLGFDDKAAIAGAVIRLKITCQAGHGIDRNNPPLHWEYFAGVDAQTASSNFLSLPVGTTADERDTTGGFMNSEGNLTLYLPRTMKPGLPQEIANQQGNNFDNAYWIRCRYTLDTKDERNRYDGIPVIQAIHTEVLGMTVAATNAVCVEEEELGVSNGEGGQTFRLRHNPIVAPPSRRQANAEQLARHNGKAPQAGHLVTDEVLEVEEERNGVISFVPWYPVADFTTSTRHDPHFILDRTAGEVRLGPAVRESTGSMRQYGRVPPVGRRIRIRRYWHSGGAKGNLASNRIIILQNAIPYVDSVSNREPARNGRDVESLEAAKVRARKEMRRIQRAVTAEDYESLLLQRPDIARVKCLAPYEWEQIVKMPVSPSTIVILVVPDRIEAIQKRVWNQLWLSTQYKQQLYRYLEPYRMLTAKVIIQEPCYIGIRVVVEIQLVDGYTFTELRAQIQAKLQQWITPLHIETVAVPERTNLRPLLTGNSSNLQQEKKITLGWEFGKSLFRHDIYAAIQHIPGVRRIEALHLYKCVLEFNPLADSELAEDRRQTVEPVIGDHIELAQNMLLCSLDHHIIQR